MNKFLLLFCFVFFCTTITFSQDFLIGNIDREMLMQSPYNQWFQEEWNNYAPNEKVLEQVNLHNDHIEIKVLLATWCSDSRRELPRFLKIMDKLDFEASRIHMTGLDREKKSPDYMENTWNIEYVPTFIFLYDGFELGRIIETPELSLEEDIRNILGYKNEDLPDVGEFKENFIVEEMPRFPGCEELDGSHFEKEECAREKLMEFILENVQYPQEAREKGIEGTVSAGFVVDEEGYIVNSSIVKGIGNGCDAEVIRIINMMNTMPQRWVSGKKRGEKIAVQYGLPVKFNLN